jgi:archaellum component FlaC
MNTLDKINSELSLLQDELSQLKHYTQEIGNAKEASTAVVHASKEFLTTFQKRVEEINKEMAKASSDFTSTCEETSATFDSANLAFQNGIAEAKNTLKLVGDDLSVLAGKVNQLALKIDSINILGHFEKIHSNLLEVNKLQVQKFSEMNIVIQKLSDEQKFGFSKTNKTLFKIAILGVLVLLFGFVLLIKIFKVI